jgi:hypothetical protein
MRNRNRIFLLPLLAIVTAVALGEQPNSSIATVLSTKQARQLEHTAATPNDHLRLAIYYKQQMSKFDAKMRYHEEMAEMYRRTPLPFDGKMAVPMQRHCKEWAARFDEQAERASVMATLHEYKAKGQAADSTALAHVSRVGLRNSGFGTTTAANRVVPANRDQTSLFEAWSAASARFYDRTKVLTYIVDAKGKPPVAIAELRTCAAGLFDAQHDEVCERTQCPNKSVGIRCVTNSASSRVAETTPASRRVRRWRETTEISTVISDARVVTEAGPLVKRRHKSSNRFGSQSAAKKPADAR